MTETTYQVVYASSRDDLEEYIAELMLVGWTPQGGVCVVIDDKFATAQGLMSRYGYYQAMTRVPR